jgi:hypothetical protein
VLLAKILVSAGGALLAMGAPLATAPPAWATFPGSLNGNIAFVALCNNTIGEPVYSINPNGSPPPTYTCPGGVLPNYTQSSAGPNDSEPYFSSQGSTLYFSGSRAATNNSFAIYSVPYPPSIGGSPPSQTDGATQISFPTANGNSFNDYDPTVDAGGNTLAFIRCDSSTTACTLETQSPIVGGTAVTVVTAMALAPPDPGIGAGNRPEIDPADPKQILYTGTDHHIHLVSLNSPASFAERDISVESGVAGAQDEYPDWKPDGTAIILDSNRNGGHKVFTISMTNPAGAAQQLWSTDPGNEIEPIYSPDGTKYAWTKIVNTQQIQVDEGTSYAQPNLVLTLTGSRAQNSEPTWQSAGTIGGILPEAPYAVLLPGGSLLAAGLVLMVHRRRRAVVAA